MIWWSLHHFFLSENILLKISVCVIFGIWCQKLQREATWVCIQIKYSKGLSQRELNFVYGEGASSL